MRKKECLFTYTKVDQLFDTGFEEIRSLYPENKLVIVTDDNVSRHQRAKLEGFTVLSIPAGDSFKKQQTVDDLVNRLLQMEADKETMLVGLGGGVVTDITGYTASIFKRGIRLGLVPSSLLAMVDAAIGGKNGVDVGQYKNMVGTTYQPEFILFDLELLKTLPRVEWVNGFAEIIKHACIRDAALFCELESRNITDYQDEPHLLADLVERNIAIKTNIVTADEFEKGERKLLNFGHTFGHAIENINSLPHGHAISIGMVMAATIAEEINNFPSSHKTRLIKLLQQYELPTQMKFDKDKAWQLLLLDKKRCKEKMHFILPDEIGRASTRLIPLPQLKNLLEEVL